MKIHEYYRGSANITLNGSIAALVPAIIIGVGNLYYLQNNQIMILMIPFIVYSLISFQIYLFRVRQSVSIERNMTQLQSKFQNIFEARDLVVVFMNHQQPCLHLFFLMDTGQECLKNISKKGYSCLENLGFMPFIII